MFRDFFHPPVSFACTNPDINLAGSKIANKPVSFRKLCAPPDLKLSRSTLINIVRVAAQRQFLIDGGILRLALAVKPQNHYDSQPVKTKIYFISIGYKIIARHAINE